jgi:hypothetical protein
MTPYDPLSLLPINFILVIHSGALTVDNMRGGSVDSFRRHLVLCSDCALLNLTIYYSKYKFAFRNPTYYMVSRDSSVGIPTPYGLDGPGIESRWGRTYRAALGFNQPPAKWVPVLFPGSKTPGA